MNKVFLDTNIILDYLMAREPFAEHARLFFEGVVREEIEIYISVLSVCNISYIYRKMHPGKDIYEVLNDLTSIVKVVSLDETIIHQALATKQKDFEDAIQYFSAISVGSISNFVTRNKPDFTETTIPLVTPAEYWA